MPDTPLEQPDDPTPSAEGVVRRVGNLARLPFRLASAGGRVTRRLTTDAVQVGRDVIEGALDGEGPDQLADRIISSTSATLDDALRSAAELTDPEAIARQVQDFTRPMADLARPMTSRLSAPVTGLMGGSAETVEEVRAELRRMGRELLRRSAALDDPEEHPAYRHILAQMAPDEARIVRLLATKGAQPVVDVVEFNAVTRNSREVVRHVSLIGREAGCIRPHLTPAYLDNLVRLGLVDLRDFQVGGQEAYELLYAQPEIDDLEEPAGFMTKNRMVHLSVELSMLGLHMYEVCFTDGDRSTESRGSRG